LRTIAIFILSSGLLAFNGTTYSQIQLKIGHANVMKILTELPERDSAELILDKETKEIETYVSKGSIAFTSKDSQNIDDLVLALLK
jgi:hypothetical protein